MVTFLESFKGNIINSIKANKALLIDLDGTLVDYVSNESKALKKLFENLNLPTELYEQAQEDFEKINSFYWSQFEQKKISILDVQYKRFEDLLEKLHIKADPKVLNKTYLDFLVQTTSVEIEIVESLKKLKSLGIKIVIITNGIHWTQTERLKNSGLDKIIDTFFTSESVGFAKPHPKMFLDSKNYLESIQCSTNELWVIGDNIEADIKGAFNVGFNTCWISKNPTHNIDYSNEKAYPTIIASSFIDFVEFYQIIKES